MKSGEKMQFRDLNRQYHALKSDIDEQVNKVMEQSSFISGQQVEDLEEKLAEYVGVKYCATCANGTDALQLALMAWGIGVGDIVFVPDFTFFSTAEVVANVGATPVFVDIDPETFNMSPDSLKKAINYVKGRMKGRLKAVIPVDLFGQPADFLKIKKIAEEENLLILEDAAQGFGGSIMVNSNMERACSFGDISTTSFFPAKPLGCYGDGGAVFTNNEEWYSLVKSMRVHGKGDNKYDNVRLGMNSRLDTLQAAILLVKLEAFKKRELDDVNRVAKLYGKLFENYELDSNVLRLPNVQAGFTSSWAQYTILLQDGNIRADVQKKLKESGIPSMIYYPKGLHEQKALNKYQTDELSVDNTNSIVQRCLSLPLHPYMNAEEVENVVENVQKIIY